MEMVAVEDVVAWPKDRGEVITGVRAHAIEQAALAK